MSATDIAKSVDVDLDLIQEQAASVAEELIAAAKMKEGQILVVGCSSSEIAAHAWLLFQQGGWRSRIQRPL